MMSAFARAEGATQDVAEANLEVGVGDHGAPSANAARPKPTEGGTEAQMVETSNACAIVVVE